MICDFAFLAFISFFVYNLATGTVSIKCFNFVCVVTIIIILYVSLCFNVNFNFSITTFGF